MRILSLPAVLFLGTLAGCMAGGEAVSSSASRPQDRCAQLASTTLAGAPVTGLTLSRAQWQAAGSAAVNGGSSAPLPAHCLVEGYFAERPGRVGGHYRIGFRMRLPDEWNGRFLFQGGGGSNGVVGDATGLNGPGNISALERHYAVVAQDSGHDNNSNNVPALGGELVFGHDPQARADYGHTSLKPVNDLAHHVMRTFYGKDSETDFFWGCSKGGQEGMAFAQRYPDAFDGIVAMAPGMSLPRAALAQAWDTQAFARILEARGEPATPEKFAGLFSAPQITSVQAAILDACDGLDNTKDGVIGAVGQCTTARVEPQLRKRQCGSGEADCLQPEQVDALVRAMGGPKDSSGAPLYSEFTWDSGVGAPGWLAWKLGTPGMLSRNILLGGGSLAAVFTTPPTALTNDPTALLAWQLAFDFDADARKIYATSPSFRTSAWQDVGMRSTDLSAFRAGGGKLIVPHGVSDPVFSIMDTIDWWTSVNQEQGGTAADFVRVFPIPGMNHCGGGPATDHFDSLSALEDWVLRDRAPDELSAVSSPQSAQPRRQMPLCPFPKIATRDQEGAYSCSAAR